MSDIRIGGGAFPYPRPNGFGSIRELAKIAREIKEKKAEMALPEPIYVLSPPTPEISVRQNSDRENREDIELADLLRSLDRRSRPSVQYEPATLNRLDRDFEIRSLQETIRSLERDKVDLMKLTASQALTIQRLLSQVGNSQSKDSELGERTLEI